MKTFHVKAIITRKNGDIVLEGTPGSITIRRSSPFVSTAQAGKSVESDPTTDNDHRVTVEEIFAAVEKHGGKLAF